MNDPDLQNALRLRQAGRLAEAAQLYDAILRRDPKHFEALHALALVRFQSGQLEEAAQLIGRAVAVNPRAAEALFNRAMLFGRLGRLNEALADFDRVVALRPDLVEAWRNRGGLLATMGRLEEALASLDRLLQIAPADQEGLRQRADLLLMLKREADAWEAYGAYLGRYPRDAEAWNHRGIAGTELKRTAEALACFDRATALAPDDADAWNNRANALFELKRYAEAAVDYGRALQLAPDLPFAEGYRVQSHLRCCDWRQLDEERRRLKAALQARRQAIDPFGSLVLSHSPEEQLQCARIWIADAFPEAHTPLWRGEIYRHEKIRVAYLSGDFRPHPVAFLIAGVFEHHDRSRFETVGVSFGPPSDSALRRRIEEGFDRFVDVRSQSDAEVATLLRKQEIDIAVDLMGFTEGCRTGIFAFHPAPVQVNYLGYPGTMGAGYMDYIIADRILIPERERNFYAEQVVYLPDSYQANDSQRPIAERIPTRAELGLPEGQIVFCCFNTSGKILPDIFDVWMRVMRAVEGSVLWLLEDNATVAGNLRREAGARGIEPQRLLFAPRTPAPDHLARQKCADLFLDTLPYNAHTTASDALWAGLPVLTCVGGTFASRVGASLLTAVGLTELITRSLGDYEALAVKLATEPGTLAAIREKLARNRENHALFDTATITHHLESAYGVMHDRQRRGEKPAGFEVVPVRGTP